MPDNKVELLNNGKHYAKISLVAIGAISSIVSVIIFCGGFVVGFTTFKADIGQLSSSIEYIQSDNKNIQSRIDILSGHITEDRQALTNRLTGLETESKYISQGVAELKLANIPKR